MNRFKTLLLTGVALSSLLGACSYEDKTTYAGDPMPEIKIDTVGIPARIIVYREDTLRLKPSVSREGNPDKKFDYEWRITLEPGSDFKQAKTISEEETLEYVISELPDTRPYNLWYRVTDQMTGLMQSIMWELTVDASSGQGLVVATTSDERTTDFSIVQDSLCTGYYYEKGTTKILPTSYRYNYFSKQNNGKTMDGVVKWMFSQPRIYKGRSTYMLHGASKHNLFRMNSINHEVILEGMDNFYDPFFEIDVDYYLLQGEGTYTNAVLSNKGRVYGLPRERNNQNGFCKFGLDLEGTYKSNSMVSDYAKLAWFEPETGLFKTCDAYIASWTEAPTPFTQAYDGNGSIVGFDLSKMKGSKQIAAGQGRNEHCFILEKDGKVGLYCLTKSFNAPFNPSRMIDITDAPRITEATSFVFTVNEDVVFYSVGSEVKAIIFSSGRPKYVDVYNAGEEIGFLEMLKQTGEKYVPYNQKCLLVATASKQGKIHALKLGNSNTGEYIDVTIFDGFNGRITALAVQD